jgi:manganese efflux pump family protein
MDIAALVTWVITAGGGFTLLVVWLSRRRQPARVRGGDAGGTGAGDVGRTDLADARPRLTPQLVFSHAGLAVLGLVLWIVYLATDSTGLARATLVVVLVVAVLGFTMLARWLRGRSGSGQDTGRALAGDADGRPEDGFPLPVVVAHGVFAAVTLVLVLLVALRG